MIDGRAIVGAGITLGAATLGAATLGSATGAVIEGMTDGMSPGTTVEMMVMMLTDGADGRALDKAVGKADGVGIGREADGAVTGILGTARLEATSKETDGPLAGALGTRLETTGSETEGNETGTLGTARLVATGNETDGTDPGMLGTATLRVAAGRDTDGTLTGRLGTADVTTGRIEDRRDGGSISLGTTIEGLGIRVGVGLMIDGSVKIPVPANK